MRQEHHGTSVTMATSTDPVTNVKRFDQHEVEITTTKKQSAERLLETESISIQGF